MRHRAAGSAFAALVAVLEIDSGLRGYGVSLGEVVSITEGYQNTSYRYVESAAAMEMAVPLPLGA